MTKKVTVLAPAKLGKDFTEADMLAASKKFQDEFVSKEPGILRRELVKAADGSYIDIVQFRSQEDLEDVLEKEMKSDVCKEFFGVMDLSDWDPDAPMPVYQVLETFTR